MYLAHKTHSKKQFADEYSITRLCVTLHLKLVVGDESERVDVQIRHSQGQQ